MATSSTPKIKLKVTNFRGLDVEAKKRVQDALKTALAKELRKAGHDPAVALFGDGSVKG